MGEAERELRGLEESLWRPQTRFDRAYMEAIMAPGFVEVGRSGRIYDRGRVLSAAPHDIRARLPLPGFAIRMIGDDVALVTYRSEVDVEGEVLHANRCSLWRRVPSGWLLEFHQGTPTAPTTEQGGPAGT